MRNFVTSAVCVLASIGAAKAQQKPSSYAEIRVVDSATGRGVPLVELETVNNLLFVTDNAGRVAFDEPGLLGEEVFFLVRSHGYEVKKDGFGMRGVRVNPQIGKVAEIKVERTSVAERMCRLTGEGLYRDTQLLGHPVPIATAPHPGKVAGQDSVQSVIHRNKVYWFWGDTQQMKYPLGLFRMAGATTSVPDPKSPPPDSGLPFDYFVDPKSQFARAMMPLPERPEGVVWVFAVFVVPDEKGAEKLVGFYTRRKSLAEEVEQGIAVYNDEKELFESVVQLPKDEKWRKPSGHPIKIVEGGKEYLLFGSPNPNVRVPATLKAVLDPANYEAFTCAKSNNFSAGPDLGEEGKPRWRWQKELAPVDSKTEVQWIKAKKLDATQARFAPTSTADPKELVELHSGTVRWNDYRKKFVMLACQINGKSSHLGEVWFAEADAPTGPFPQATKVLSHDRQTFYNVNHHAFLDRDGGKSIYFEGTYTNDFSGNPHRTPRYNYNQVLYRLDVSSPSLRNN